MILSYCNTAWMHKKHTHVYMTISLLRYSSECNIIFIAEKKIKQILFEKLVYDKKKKEKKKLTEKW